MTKYLLILLLAALPCAAISAVLAIGVGDTITVTLFDEPCAFDVVSNLPFRARWTEPGHTYEGCWSSNKFGTVMLYFEDKTIVGIPVQAFHRASEV